MLRREIAGVFLCSKHLVPVLYRTPVPERGLAAFLVVITYIFIYCFFEFIKAIVNLPIVHFLFHDPEEVLHWRIVVTITFARHALEYAIISQLLTVNTHLVCPAAVRMESPSVLAVASCIDGFVKCNHYAISRRPVRDSIA